MNEDSLPPLNLDVHGRAWTPESKVIVALMRRLQVQTIYLSAEELASARGMMIAPTTDSGVVVVLDSAH